MQIPFATHDVYGWLLAVLRHEYDLYARDYNVSLRLEWALNVRLEKIRKLRCTYLYWVRYGHYQLASGSENFIHPAIHDKVSLSLNSWVSIQPGKNHKINAICTNTTIFEERFQTKSERLLWFHSLVVFKTVTAWSEHKHQLNRKNLLQRAACLKHKERNGSYLTMWDTVSPSSY